MSSALRSMGGAAGRVRARLGHRDEYAFCPDDGFWFRPLYTGGKCPLCGEEAISEETPRLGLLMRFDRFSFGMATLALVSLGMCALVLFMYFSA